HGELEVLQLAAGIGVVHHRLGGDLQDVVQRVGSGGNVDRLDVRFALGGGFGEAAAPHAVEFAPAVFDIDAGVLDDEAGQAVVGFHQAHQRLRGEQAAQLVATDVGGGPDLAQCLVELGGGNALCVADFDQFATPLGQRGDHGFTHAPLHAFAPVVAMDHVIGLVLAQVGDVVQRFLGNDPRDALEAFDHLAALLVGHV